MYVYYNRITGIVETKPTDELQAKSPHLNYKYFSTITQDQIDFIALGKYKVNTETLNIELVEGWTNPTIPTI